MKMRKIIAIVAAVLMLVSVMPIAAFAADTTVSYDFSTFSGSSTQYAQQSHDLGNGLNVSMVGCHINTQLRFYNSQSSVEAIFNVTDKEITSMTLNAGYKAGDMTVSTSADGATWSDAGSITTTTSYTDYTVNFDSSAKYVKLGKGTGTAQIRIKTVSFTVVDAAGGEEPPVTCEHVWVDANCTTPKTCSLCGATEGEALGHSYGEAVETVAPDCTNAGEKQSTCSACGDVKTETVKALGHNYVDGVCSVCGAEEPAISEYTIDFSTTTQRVSLSTTQQVWQNGGLTVTNDKASSTSNVADYSNPVRFYKSSTVTIACAGMTSLVISTSGNSWNDTLDNATLTYSVDGTTYTITFAEPIDSITLTCAAQIRALNITAIVEKQAESDCEHDYVGVETQAPTCSAEGVMTYTCSKCGDEYTEAIATIPHDYAESIVDSTCTATGTATYTCSVCFDSYDEVIPMKSHNYVDDVCDVCGAVKAYKGTITFDADKTQRVEYTTQIQIWENEGLNVTNNKASSTTNVGDYSGRFYKNSEIIISFPEMATLIIDATGVDNDKLWDATLEAAGLSFTVENKIYTITFAEPVNSIELTAANQVRANSITAIVAHECVWTDATCTAPKTCSKCGATEGEALGHSYDNDFDANCNVCGEIRVVDSPISYIAKSVSEDVSGYAVLFQADVEGIVVKEGTFVQADFTNATYNSYKLLGLGVEASNGVSETTIEGLRMYELEDGCAKFAFRIINIPADKLDVEITMTPYYVIEIDGVATTIYGEDQVGSYAEVAG